MLFWSQIGSSNVILLFPSPCSSEPVGSVILGYVPTATPALLWATSRAFTPKSTSPNP
jgi:hypothetical protein